MSDTLGTTLMIVEYITDKTLVQEHIYTRYAMERLAGSSKCDRRIEIPINYSLVQIWACFPISRPWLEISGVSPDRIKEFCWEESIARNER
jgi:hypothetical protein